LQQGTPANIEAQDDNWLTPLQLAVSKNKLNVARVLLDTGANVEAHCNFWAKSQLPLFLAVSNDNKEMIQLLLDHDADVEATSIMTSDGTPLGLAAKDGLEGVVSLLLAKGADVEAKDKFGNTPLYWATMHKHVEVITILLQHGARSSYPTPSLSMFLTLMNPAFQYQAT
jgi:cytohesin